ncbi:uncharacterized protein C3orf38 homolog isoform X2 [Adelges cooleyi]|uniref:uncharacterized protein C3orf38 homolog isoform X2 n=1 Tax=Adelges cooleyi TaxID=133065 RepID=UPI0021806C53|nr:uncharacterized protein C3orf38 homolog isoform X2 [Adelges cooleyi]
MEVELKSTRGKVANPVQPGILKNMMVQAQPAPPTQDLLEDFIKMFGKHFYNLLNDNALDDRYFFENSSMAVIIASNTEEIKEQYHDTASVIQGLYNIKQQHHIFFAPTFDQVKWKKESHGLIKVQIGGTLHQGVGRMVGVFDQAFVLREDPIAQNTWKILSINFYLKSLVQSGPSNVLNGNEIKSITY